jgi:hypothetical protein
VFTKSAVSADPRTASVMFPQGTIVDGLPKVATTGSTTRIQFPKPWPPPSTKPSRTTPEDGESFGYSYVNDTGRATMFAQGRKHYPAGTVIVRERLIPPSTSPDRLVVMIKHEPMFNPKSDGWEFLTVDGAMTKILKRERNGNCLKCHENAKQTDFVFVEGKR